MLTPIRHIRNLTDAQKPAISKSHAALLRKVIPAGRCIVQSYVKNGIKDIIRYNISPNSSAALRKVDGSTEARIIQMACSPASEGHSRWTLQLLEEKSRIELDVPVGREAIRQTPKKRLLAHPSKRKRRIRSLHGGYPGHLRKAI